MGFEAASSNTPILDLIRPLPSSSTNLASVVIGLIWGALFGVLLIYAMGENDNGLLWFLPMLFVVVTIHEFGHAIAGHLVGFQLQGMSIGPVCVSNELGKWKFRLRGVRDALGLTAMHIDRIGRLRRRYVWMIVAGPLANLITGGVVLLLDPLFRNDENSQVHQVLLLFALVSFWTGLSSLVPIQGRTYSSDGQRLRMLLCSPTQTRRLLGLMALNSVLRRIPPKGWNQRWIRTATAVADESLDCFRANWFAYLSANDRNEEKIAAHYLERCLSLAGTCGRQMRGLLALEAAVFTAWFRRDAEKAKAWMQRAHKKQYVPKIMELRIRIVMHCVDSRFDEAISIWNEGLSYLQSLPASPHRELLETSWREWSTEIEERRTSKSLSTVTSG